jgi:hypothetical protein
VSIGHDNFQGSGAIGPPERALEPPFHPYKKPPTAALNAFSRGALPATRPDMDSLAKRDTPDRSKINMDRPREVHYWTKHLDISKEDLQKAIDKVGNSAAAVRKELRRLGKEQIPPP